MSHTNTTRETVSLPGKKAGSTVDIRGGETSTEALDMDHAMVKGHLIAGTIVADKGAAKAVETAQRPAKAE